MKRGLIASCLGLAVAVLAVRPRWSGQARPCADSWALPETTTYLSASKGCRLTIVPRDLENQLAYFAGEVDNSEKLVSARAARHNRGPHARSTT